MERIVIAGGGISGTLTYLFLKQHLSPIFPRLNIHIYEKLNAPPYHNLSKRTHVARLDQDIEYDVTHVLPGVVEIAANGIRCLNALDPSILNDISRFGYRFRDYGVCDLTGRYLGREAMGSDDQDNGSIFIMRADLLDILLWRVNQQDITYGETAEVIRLPLEAAHISVLRVITSTSTVSPPRHRRADLLIDAGGSNSGIRRSLSKEMKPVPVESITVGAFLDERTTRLTLLNHPNAVVPTMSLTVTRTFFGRIYIMIDKEAVEDGKPQSSWHQSEDRHRGFPFAGWWCTVEARHVLQIPRAERNFARIKNAILGFLALEPGTNSLFSALIEVSYDAYTSTGFAPGPSPLIPAGSQQAFVEHHTKQTELKKYWNFGGRLVVLGDAAHSMPIDTTQGISLAIEDARSIAMLMARNFAALQRQMRLDTSYVPNTSLAYSEPEVFATLMSATTQYSRISYARYHAIKNWRKRKCPDCRGWPFIESRMWKACGHGRFCQASIKRLWSYKVEEVVQAIRIEDWHHVSPAQASTLRRKIGQSLRVCGSIRGLPDIEKHNRQRSASRSHDTDRGSQSLKDFPVQDVVEVGQPGRNAFGRVLGPMSYRQHIAQHTTLMVPGQSARSPAPRLPSNPSPDDITPSDQPLQDASNSRNIDKSRRKRKPVKDTFEGREAEGQAAQPEPKDGAASPLDSNPDTRGEGSTGKGKAFVRVVPVSQSQVEVHELDTDGASSSGGHGCDADLVPPIIVTSPTDSTDSGLE